MLSQGNDTMARPLLIPQHKTREARPQCIEAQQPF